MTWVLVLAKATLVAVLALSVTWALRRNRASVRHAVLAAAFAVLAGLPVLTWLVPTVRIPVGRPVAAAPTIQNARLFVGRARPLGTPAPATSNPLLLAYVAGLALFLMPAAAGLWRLRRLHRCATPWLQGQRLADRLGRSVDVLLSSELAGPMTCGVLRPAIVMPMEAEQWSEEDVTRALVHELEHVRRCDWLTLTAARLICAVYWFHPLVWMAWRRFCVEAERTCDDAVLRRSDPAAYADQLVELARRLNARGGSPVPAMANPSDLATRVRAVLDGRQRRGPAGWTAIAAACTGAAVAVAMAPLVLVAAQDAPVARFSASSRMVVQTIYVRGGDGNNIEGLSANDFTVLENGKKQQIANFSFQRLPEPRDGVTSYYTLGYYTTNDKMDGEFRKIEVICAKEPSARVEFRQGYYAGRQPSAALTEQFRRVVAKQAVQAPPGTTPPQLIYKKEPEYTEEARKAKYQGTVTLYVEIDETGSVRTTRVLHSLGLGLDEKAAEAVRQWKFKPAMKNGKPIPYASEVEVQFRLL